MLVNSSPAAALPEFDVAPYRLSGVVYAALLNHTPQLAELGEALHQAPYKAPPRAPVLALRPRNTLAGDAAEVTVPVDAAELLTGATLGLVIARTVCRVALADAPACIAGYLLVNDYSVPHASHYRPAVRQHARDGFCLIGPVVLPTSAAGASASPELELLIDDRPVQCWTTRALVRGAAQLLADVSAFMTLRPGDVLTLGTAADAPRARAGQRVTLRGAGLGELHNRVAAARRPA